MVTETQPHDERPMAPTTTEDVPTSLEPLSQAELERLEEERLTELRARSLQDPDPLRANLGAACARMLRIGAIQERAARAAFEAGMDPIDAWEVATPAVRMCLTATALAGRLSSALE
jgi:hypothetical protein